MHRLRLSTTSDGRSRYGRDGELRVRGPQLMAGYMDAGLTAAHMDEDGWYYSGDTGFVTADGCITMTGRIKDIINRGGEKFSSQDIENVVLSHPAVRAAAVVAVADRRLGEEVACFVELSPDAEWLGHDDIRSYLEEVHLSRQKIPRYWHVVDVLPRTPSGKVKKDDLLRLWESAQPRIVETHDSSSRREVHGRQAE